MPCAFFDTVRAPSFSFTVSGVRTEVPVTGEETLFTRDGVTARWTLEPLEYGALVRLELSFPQKTVVEEISPLSGAYAAPAGTRAVLTDALNSGTADALSYSGSCGRELYLFRNGEGVLGRSLYPLNFAEQWEISRRGPLTGFALRTFPPLSYRSGTFVSRPLYIGTGDMNGCIRECNALQPQIWQGGEPVVGYNTWDYYFTDISEECVEENLEVIRRTPFLRDNLKYFTLDDGWQMIQGEWYPNSRFPGGLHAVCRRIRETGLIPGVWTAPLHVWQLSAYAMRRMQGFLCDDDGDPVAEGGMYVLDPTHPDAQAYIRGLYTRLYDAGFRLYKVDYLGILPKIRHFYDPGCSQYEAIRRLFSLIRECVHDDSVILGCSPIEAGSAETSTGRTGIDIHNTWEHALWCLEGFQYRWGGHRRIWVNDPDFLVVRGPQTDCGDTRRNPIDPAAHKKTRGRWRRGRDFTLDEARSWAAMVLLAGGNVNLSDRLAMLNGEGMRILEKAMTHRRTEAAVPQDQFFGDYACIWRQGNRLIVINCHDEERTFRIPETRTLRDLWTEKDFLPENGLLAVQLRPHESAVLEPVS